VASGIPVYRGEDKSRYDDPDALRYAFASTLHKDPGGFWTRFRGWRAELRRARPNAGHVALATLEQRAQRFLLATQNVDDLHYRAGSVRIVKLHGDAFALRCRDASCRLATFRWSSDPDDDTSAEVPVCPLCETIARPDVVLFGEGGFDRWEPVRKFVAEGVEIVLLVGTSGVVEVPTQLIQLARAKGPVWVATVNPRPPEGELASLVDAQVLGRSEEILPRLVESPT